MYTIADLKICQSLYIHMKIYAKNFTSKHLLFFEIGALKIDEKFVYRHSDIIEYRKILLIRPPYIRILTLPPPPPQIYVPQIYNQINILNISPSPPYIRYAPLPSSVFMHFASAIYLPNFSISENFA